MEELTWKSILENNKQITFIVGKNQMKNFLTNFDNEIDEEGFIINSQTKERVISQDEGEVKIKELGSISSGSKIFIKNNIASFSEFLSQERGK